MLKFLTMGIVLGLSAGITPGPLFVLVITETMRHGLRAGVLVALAPLITDLPIVCLSVFILGHYAQSTAVLGVISLLGGAFVSYLGIENFCAKRESAVPGASGVSSFKKAVVVNTLSPHPYLFWLTVGAPAVIKASRQNYTWVAAFVVSFYLLLVGAKVVLSRLVAGSKNFLAGRAYANAMKILGLVLMGLAAVLFYDGLVLLKCI